MLLEIVLFILLGGSLLIVFNLLRKLEAYEDMIELQDKYLLNISNTIREGKKQIDTLDAKGIFQSDDEVGIFFDAIKVIQENLNLYIIDVENASEKKE